MRDGHGIGGERAGAKESGGGCNSDDNDEEEGGVDVRDEEQVHNEAEEAF